MPRNDRDFYPTPHSIIREMLARIEWASDLVWEPCAGDNRLVDAMRSMGATVIAHDIETGNDFFDWTTAHADTLITNPPFMFMRKFIDHAFNIGVQRMALVCSERLWSCERGREQWQRHRPSRFVNLTWREDYLRKNKSPDRALAISIWDTPHADKCSYEIWNKSDQPSLFEML